MGTPLKGDSTVEMSKFDRALVIGIVTLVSAPFILSSVASPAPSDIEVEDHLPAIVLHHQVEQQLKFQREQTAPETSNTVQF